MLKQKVIRLSSAAGGMLGTALGAIIGNFICDPPNPAYIAIGGWVGMLSGTGLFWALSVKSIKTPLYQEVEPPISCIIPTQTAELSLSPTLMNLTELTIVPNSNTHFSKPCVIGNKP